jgi:UDP-3-O-[3-hydroxymyristoyl] glucosamine N-acyltransferase
MGGQVGIADHVRIPDGVMIAAKTRVSGSIKEEKCIVAGYPHMDIRKWRRSNAVFRNLKSYTDHIKSLETKIKEIEKQKETEEK